MKTKNETEGQPQVGSDAGLGVVRPPVFLPNGKRNPAYLRWYYTTNKDQCKEKYKRYKSSAKGKRAIARYNQSAAGRAAHARYEQRKIATNGLPSAGQLKCVECGIEYEKLTAIERGYQIVGKQSCVCDLCA